MTLYDSSWIRFFAYAGDPGGTYYDYVVIPYSASMDSNLGLTYSDELGTFFHSWGDGSTYYISELQITGVGLENTTWGEIKSNF